MNRMLTFSLSSATLLAALLWSTPAQACHQTMVCVRFPVTGNDLSVGAFPDPAEDGDDDDENLTLPGVHVRVMLIPPPPEVPFMAMTDSQGCFPVTTELAWGHKLFVYPEAYFGETGHIRVTGYTSYENLSQDVLQYWEIDLPELVENGSVEAPVETEAEPMSVMFAWMLWMVERTDTHLQSLESPAGSFDTGTFYQLRAYTAEAGSPEVAGDNSAYLGAYSTKRDIFITYSPDSGSNRLERKFLLGHEFSHWVQQNWTGVNLGNGVLPNNFYDYPAQETNCQFTAAPGSSSLHGLRSAEYGSAGVLEGFAHFMSTWLFDDGGAAGARFKYYKPALMGLPQFSDVEDDNYIVSLLGGTCPNEDLDDLDCPLGGPSQWVENYCSDDFVNATSEISSEIDWMRFLWQFVSGEVADTDEEDDVPDLWHVLELLRIASTSPTPDNPIPDWADLDATIGNSGNSDIYPFSPRWDHLTTENGVNNNL